MTKTVRIENADNSPFKVKITRENRNAEGIWVPDEGTVKVLHQPTNMAEFTIWDGSRLVIEDILPSSV